MHGFHRNHVMFLFGHAAQFETLAVYGIHVIRPRIDEGDVDPVARHLSAGVPADAPGADDCHAFTHDVLPYGHMPLQE